MKPLRVHTGVVLAYGLLTVVMTWPLARQAAVAIPGDSFDGWQNYWNLWWIKIALIDRVQWPYQTDLLYYPTGVSLYFHTLNPFNGLASLPVQLTAGLIPAYNFVVLISWTLAGYGLYLLVCWSLRPGAAPAGLSPLARQAGAFVAGAIYTFAPFHMAHLLGHMQVMSLQWLPFYVLALLRAVERNRAGRPWWASAGLAGFFLALAGLCDWYFVLYLLLFTGLVVIWSWVSSLWRRRVSPRDLGVALWPALVAGGVFALLLSPILAPMVQEARRYSFMVRPSADLYIFSASLMDFLVPNRLHTLLRPESYTWIGNQLAPPSERTISIGYVALGLAALGLWVGPRRALFWGIAALFFLLLALGPAPHLGNITWDDIPKTSETAAQVSGWSPYALLNRLVPFMRISRSVSRFALPVQLGVAVLAGMGLAAWLNQARPQRRAALGALCLALALAESWVAPYPLSPPDTPAYYSELAATPGPGAVLNLPMNYDRPGYLLYQTVHKRPLAVAYISRDDPRTLTARAPALQHFRHLGPDILELDPAQVGMTVLADLGISHVVLDRYKMPGGLEREYTTALAAAIFAGQTPVYEDERLTVYTVTPPAAPQPYLVLGPEHWGPLVTGDNGKRSRRLGAGPATLTLHHVPAEAALRITYRTAPGATLELRSADGQAVLAALPPSPEPATVTLPLGELRGGSASPPDMLALLTTGAVDILGLGLQMP